MHEIMHLPPSLPDERKHDNIGRHAAREGRQKSRFAHAGPGEKAHPLAPHNRQQRIERREAGLQPPPEAAPLRCGRRAGAEGAPSWPGIERMRIQRLTVGVDDPTDPAIGGRQGRRAQHRHAIPLRHAISTLVG